MAIHAFQTRGKGFGTAALLTLELLVLLRVPLIYAISIVNGSIKQII